MIHRVFGIGLVAVIGCSASRVHSFNFDDVSLIPRCSGQPSSRDWAPAQSRLRGLGLTPFEECWFSDFLEAMNEPSLDQTDSTAVVYRFLRLPSFSPAEAVRVTHGLGSTEVTYKRTVGPGGYRPQGLAAARVAAVSDSTWSGLEARLAAARFWTTAPDSVRGADGEEWIFEARVANRRRLVKVWSPEPNGRGAAYVALGNYFLAVAHDST